MNVHTISDTTQRRICNHAPCWLGHQAVCQLGCFPAQLSFSPVARISVPAPPLASAAGCLPLGYHPWAIGPHTVTALIIVVNGDTVQPVTKDVLPTPREKATLSMWPLFTQAGAVDLGACRTCKKPQCISSQLAPWCPAGWTVSAASRYWRLPAYSFCPQSSCPQTRGGTVPTHGSVTRHSLDLVITAPCPRMLQVSPQVPVCLMCCSFM